MKYRPRIYYTDSDKELMWDRWRKGESLGSIARLFDRHHSSVQRLLSETGGIRPAARRRSRFALTLAEREEISRGVVAGHSIRSIAASLGRSPSTVSREVNRNGGRRRYRASQADQAAWDRARRSKRCKLAENRALARIVAKKLQLEWSPRQIAGWLKRTYPDDETCQVSHETIYRTLFIPGPRGLEQRAVAVLEAYTRDASLAPSHAKDSGSWPHHRCGLDPRATGRGRGPCCARPLGGRPLVRQQQQSDRDARRAPHALRHAGQGRQQRHRDRDQCAHQAGPQTPQAAIQVAHLGSWS